MYKILAYNWRAAGNCLPLAQNNFAWHKLLRNKVLKKWLMRINITCLVLFIAFMQVAFAANAQKVSLNARNVVLIDIFKQIRSQCGYDFIVPEGFLKQAHPINIHVDGAELKEVLDICFEKQPFTYMIDNHTIIVKPKKSSLLNRAIDYFKRITITGKVVDENGGPLPGASVRIKGSLITYKTDSEGIFSIEDVDEGAVLLISYIGYSTKELPVSTNMGTIKMEPSSDLLEEVSVVSTGYQALPKERATGSFEKVDNNLFNRTTGTNVVSRLNGVTFATNLGGFQPPQVLNHRTNPLATYSIRGLSTFLPNKSPLLIVDNFPYDGDINNLNPNDVESVTILKDAAASSIWGTRAGNGVIVITTKKGAFDKPLVVTLNSNVSIAKKPNLFYQPQMSSADLVDYQTFLYQNGRFNGALSDKYSYVPEVIDILDQQSRDTTNPVYQQRLDALRNHDLRNDLLKYVYRNAILQQHALNISGGSKQISYYLSGGFDKNLESLVTNGFERINLKMNSTIQLFKNLNIETGLLYTQNKYDETAGSNNYMDGYEPLPYTRLADDQGNHLAVYPRFINKNYIDTAGNGRLLNWQYKPLDEIHETPRTVKSQDVLLNLGANYKFNPIFSASVRYQFEKTHTDDHTRYRLGSYYTRNTINYYSQYDVNDLNAAVSRPITIGDILSNVSSDLVSNTVRGQLDANKTWNKRHVLNAIAGAEIREVKNDSFTPGYLYGYNDDPITVQQVNPSQEYPLYNDPDYWGTAIIPNTGSFFTKINNRFTSLYANASYTYNTRYILSASIRKDASNIFGVKPNRRGQPLWSAGASWIISDEPFFKPGFFNYLKLRATYGYQGNVSNNNSAYPIISYEAYPSPVNQLPYASTTNPPNPNLRWETVRMMNVGLDFTSINNRISGSLEYYEKRATNLIALAPVASNTGFSLLSVNSANLLGRGTELNLNSKNLEISQFQWTTNILFSYSRTKVDKYFNSNTLASTYVMGQGGTLKNNAFKEGDDAYSLYAYKWAGLDPQTGAPRGYLNGEISTDYVAIRNANMNTLENMGSVSPRYFGSFRNNFSWKNLTLSANILYKFDYVIGRSGLNYAALFSGGSTNADYAKRWKSPGDELKTNIPASIYPVNQNANSFYLSSAALVESGDHIRLQDINLAYTFPKKINFLQSLKLYANMSNVGILWRANKVGLDPDAGNNIPVPRTIAFGLNASF